MFISTMRSKIASMYLELPEPAAVREKPGMDSSKMAVVKVSEVGYILDLLRLLYL